jgi:hypothetical protein
MSLKPPYFDGRPIGSIAALARALGIEDKNLEAIASTANRRYRGPIKIPKASGGHREIFDAHPTLKNLQRRILDRILRRATLPAYLLGGVKGHSYIENAARHAGSKVILGEDIDSFYPSVTVSKVRLVFQHVFRFPPVVAEMLARLCTRNGVLVQGAVTSTDLANLVLYRTEPALEAAAQNRGLRYSRFVDDMHISSERAIPAEEVQQLLTSMRSVLEREGFKPKRKKQFVATAANVMRVHGLNVNSTPSAPRQVRRRLRTEFYLFEKRVATQPWDAELELCFMSISSRVGHLKQTNQGDAHRLKLRLQQMSCARQCYLLRRSDDSV